MNVLSRSGSPSANVQIAPADGSEPDQQLRTSVASSSPTFGEGLAARFLGAAPIQATSAVTHLLSSVVSNAATRGSIPTGIAQSMVATGVRFMAESAMHLGITAGVETGPVKRILEGLHSEQETKQDALNRVKGVSALLSAAGGVMGSVAYTAVASEILKQPQTAQDFATSVISGLVSTGVISAGVLTLYKTNPSFRSQVDKQLEQLKGLLKSQFNGPSDTNARMPPV
ncbi:hypothetical protein [Paraburkholderia aspalathi]|uniref:hypothetical protein n=1 Tax=Paraburkholderia aspalathi TaxID=1324617 RepID=UPI0038B900ED